MNENVGPIEIRWSSSGDPDDVVAPWPAEPLHREAHDAWCATQRISIHVERMGSEHIWMCIYDDLTGEDVHMWFSSKKRIRWTVRDHTPPENDSSEAT